MNAHSLWEKIHQLLSQTIISFYTNCIFYVTKNTTINLNMIENMEKLYILFTTTTIHDLTIEQIQQCLKVIKHLFVSINERNENSYNIHQINNKKTFIADDATIINLQQIYTNFLKIFTTYIELQQLCILFNILVCDPNNQNVTINDNYHIDAEDLIEITQQLQLFHKTLDDLQINILMFDALDIADCFIEIHAGAGGIDAQDWARMLLEMYIKSGPKLHFAVDVIECNITENKCIRSAIVLIKGRFAYGFFKRESGVHRLVRISPFDTNARRHTSFASVKVYADIEKTIGINIKQEDLRIDTYKSSGPGGQNVQKTESAVRITHIPTGLIAQCQNERSQLRNKTTAMKILTTKLYTYQKMQEDNKITPLAMIEWSNQIKTYVLHPYQLFKDLRTKYETSKINDMLSGDLEELLKYNAKTLIIPD